MPKIQDNFDYDPVIKAIAPWVNVECPHYREAQMSDHFLSERNQFSRALFSAYPAFLVHYLTISDFDDARDLVKIMPKDPESLLYFQNRFIKEEVRAHYDEHSIVRSALTFCLTEEEAQKGLQKMKNDSNLAMMMALFGDSCLKYFDGLKEAANYSEGRGYRSFNGVAGMVKPLEKMTNQLKDAYQFMQELLPVLAFALEGKQDLNEKDFAMGLCTTFRMQAMKSENKSIDKVKHCPFGPALGDISVAVLERQANTGRITLSDERRPGALFHFLYQEAREILIETQNTPAMAVNSPE
ncbi:MAG: hypothetical protein ACLFR0_00220 [Alphaproteobacteria bacterium]